MMDGAVIPAGETRKRRWHRESARGGAGGVNKNQLLIGTVWRGVARGDGAGAPHARMLAATAPGVGRYGLAMSDDGNGRGDRIRNDRCH